MPFSFMSQPNLDYVKHTSGNWPGYSEGPKISPTQSNSGGGGACLKDEAPQLPLQQAICFLQLQTSELNDKLDRLQKRLSVLLRNPKPVPPNVAVEPCPSAESTVSTEIIESAKRIRDLRYQVEQLLETLEV